MKFLKLFLVQLFFLFFLYNLSNSAIINKVKVNGNRQISLNLILSKISFIKGKNYNDTELNTFQKNLFNTGFFKSVNFKVRDDILFINVNENPVIDFLYIYGDKNKDRIEKLYENIELKVGNIFSDYKLLNDISKINQLYKYSGYYNVKVEPTVKLVDQHKVNISIKITKNEKLKIKNVFFIGKKFFDSATLRDVVSTSESAWWKFLSTTSYVNDDRINYDKNLLKNFFKEESFYDAQVLSANIDILDNNFANIVFSIDSGSKYYFGDFNYNNLEFFDNNNKKYLLTIFETLKNKKYSSKKTIFLKDKINEFLISNKFENLDFAVMERKNKNKIDINIDFYNKKLPTIANISVKGNSITEEKVIRNNLLFSEGDLLTNYKISKSEDNLNNLTIFKNSKIIKNKIDNDSINVQIEVEEQPTGSIMGGVGIGSNETAISFSVTEKNLFGSNITVNTDMSIGTEKIIGNFLLINPDYNDSGRLIKNNFFIQNTNYESVGYESKMVGDDISTKYQIYDDISLNLGVGFDYDTIKASSSSSLLYKSQEGNYKTFKLFYGLNNDKRNRKFKTTDGHILGFNQTMGIPGSDIPYIYNNLSGKYYYSISKDYILNLKSAISSINALDNKNVKLSNRLFLSSRQLRGFEPRSVGPVDGNDHVGGNYSYYGGVSSTFPNPLPEKWNATTLMFLDTANLWGVDYDDSKDSNKIRSSYGIGLDWTSPLGPVSFTLSNAISKASTDNDQKFSFQIGSVF